MNKQGTIFIIIAVIIVVGVIIFIGLREQRTSEDSLLTKPDAIYPITMNGDSDSPQLRVFNIEVSSNGFDPAEITVNHQDTVQFNLTALGGTYDIFLKVFDIYAQIPEGKSYTVSFKAARKGPWKFVCRDYCPEGKTIEGEIMVLEK